MVQKLLQAFFTLLALSLLGWVVWRWQINGWPSLFWVASAIAMMLIRAPYAKRTQLNAITKKQSVSVERLLLMLVAIGGTYLPLMHLATGALSFANYTLPHSYAIAGGILLIPAIWLFWRSHADLGDNWSVTTELHADQKLIISGVYQRVRHPMYAAIWVLFLLQPLFVQNWIAGFSGVGTFALMFFLRVPYEEDMMRQEFGDEYKRYCERSGRIWPKFGSVGR